MRKTKAADLTSRRRLRLIFHFSNTASRPFFKELFMKPIQTRTLLAAVLAACSFAAMAAPGPIVHAGFSITSTFVPE